MIHDCPTCGGDGRVPCGVCRGGSSREFFCSSCGSRGDEPCPSCGGRRVVDDESIKRYWRGEEAALALRPRTPAVEKALAEARAELAILDPEEYGEYAKHEVPSASEPTEGAA